MVMYTISIPDLVNLNTQVIPINLESFFTMFLDDLLVILAAGRFIFLHT